jgi:rare lipoprotein A
MRAVWALGCLLPALVACATQKPPPAPAPAPEPCAETGAASWYRPAATPQATASGETARPGALTAAHPTLPFGTHVKVTDLDSGRSVVVRITDRGPFSKDRIIDLSGAAAAQLGMRQDGVAQVRLEVDAAGGAAGGTAPTAMTDASCPFRRNAGA